MRILLFFQDPLPRVGDFFTGILFFMKIIFTDHAKVRMKERKILKRDVLLAIENPSVTVLRKDAMTMFQKETPKGILEIICKKSHTTCVIITGYYL